MTGIHLPRDGILLRSLFITLLAFIVASIGSLGYTAYDTGRRAAATVDTRLNQLLDTVELTIRTACFVEDGGLAQEVARGLLGNSEILRVRIEAGERALADERRPGAGPLTGDERVLPLARRVASPFNPAQIVGAVRLYPNPAVLDELRHNAIQLAVRQLAVQLLLVFMGIFAALTVFFVRPVARISQALHHMNPAAGDRLAIPPGHENTEIGRLVRDINGLSDHLVVAIETAQQARASAEDASNAKGTFLANMSHEIRTPLAAVIGLARIGARDSAARDSRATFVRILASGEHLLGLINDILDFSKIEAGKLAIDPQPLRLAGVIDEAIAMLAGRAGEKGVGLVGTLEPDLPAWIVGDGMRIRQILVNLLSNAVKFTERGRVHLYTMRNARSLRFHVRDEGIGMTKAQMEHLFRPFEQADSSTTRKYGGTGLGLAISMNLASLMGGDISVTSEPGQGSTFCLELPLVEAPDMAGATGDPAQQQDAIAGSLAGYRVLAADDAEVNRLILDDLLHEAGADCLIVGDGAAAVEQARQQPRDFDVVLMDIQMPVMDGLEATRQLQKIAPELPVIGLTAHVFDEARDKCLAAGMRDHVAKPIDPARLIEAIRRWAKAGGRTGSPVARVAGVPEMPAAPQSLLAAEGEIDWAELTERFRGSHGLVGRILESFIGSQQTGPARLRELAAEGDHQALAFHAHDLKSVAGNLAAIPARRLAAELEQAARQTSDVCPALAGELADRLERMLVEARQRLSAQ